MTILQVSGISESSSILVGFGCIIASGVISVVTTLLLNRSQGSTDYRKVLFDRYQSATQEIIGEILPLVSLSIYGHKSIDWQKSMSSIDKLYYKYHSYLPDDVLIAMNALYVCLSNNGQILLYCKHKGKHTSIQRCYSDQKLLQLVGEVTIADCAERHGKLLQKIKSSQGDKYVRYISKRYPHMVVNLQARYLINKINQHYNLTHLYKWDATINRRTLLKESSR